MIGALDRQAGRGDEDVDSAVLEHDPFDHLDHGSLVGHVDRKGEAAAQAVCRDELVGHLTGSLDVQVGDDDVGATLGEHARGGAADAARASGDHRDRPASSPRGGAWASLYRSSGQYSIANASLSLSDRKPPSASAASSTAMARWYRSRANRARPASGPEATMPTPGIEDDARSRRVDRERPRLVVEVPLVVLAVPGAVVGDAAPELLGERGRVVALRVEVDHERLVLRVDQVVRARRADLADLGVRLGRGEGHRLRAPVDLEDHAVRVLEQRAAESREGAEEERSTPSPPAARP